MYGATYAGQRANVAKYSREEGLPAGGRPVGGQGERGPERQHVLRSKARIDILYPPEGADSKPGDDHQDERGSDFCDDQPGPEPLGVAARSRAKPVAKPVERRRARETDGRSQAEAETGEDRERRRECHQTKVGRGHFSNWQARRHETRHEGHGRDGEQQSELPADRGQQQVLRQQLADEAFRAGADRRADRQLAPTVQGTREQQVRQVDARDEQQAARGANERRDHQTGLAADLVSKRDHGGAGLGVLGIGAREARRDAPELRAGLCRSTRLRRGAQPLAGTYSSDRHSRPA